MESEINGFLAKLECKQDLFNTLVSLQKWLAHVAGSTQEKTFRKRTSALLEHFCELQDSFAYNICGRLVRLMIECTDVKVQVELLQTVQGVCLLHRPSRQVFNSDPHLKALLTLCESPNPDVQIVAINTLCAVMVHQVAVIRRFEQLKGLKTVTDIFKHKNTPFTIKRAILEFLFFYLVPESKLPKEGRKSTADKQVMLGRFLSNVDGLVRELELNKPFGPMDLEW